MEEVNIVRIGINPGKLVKNLNLSERVITVCIINHIPVTAGYWKESIDVLKVCLDSLISNTKLPINIFVFDNASCEQAKKYLLNLSKIGQIDFLLLSSKNIGKCAAWNYLFGSVQSEFIVYSDSDVYFYPGWEKAHLDIFRNFESVGMVTGLPVREKVTLFTTSTFRQIESDKDFKITKGKLIPYPYLKGFRDSLGDDVEIYSSGEYIGLDDVMIEKFTQQAYVGASHFQFMIPTKVARSLIPFPTNKLLAGNEGLLEESVDRIGLMRLSTVKRVVHHIGNSLENDEWFNELTGKNKKLNNNMGHSQRSHPKSRFKTLLIRIVRKFLLYVYTFIVRKLS
jgi:hypothetical protein